MIRKRASSRSDSAVEGRGDRAGATVFFPEVGQKKLKLKFARLQVVG
ncbi:MAG: hypothetical protein R3362_05055 [Rhodothermales bacterium]|nr:hypothetical protein [Rhodothermales bacterium]